MKFDRFDYTVWSVCLVLVLGIAGVMLAANQIGITHYQTTDFVGVLGPIRITFEENITAPESGQHLSIYPEIAGHETYQGETISFIPDQPLQPGEQYTVTLHAGLGGESGRTIRHEISWSVSVREPAMLYLATINGVRELYRRGIPLDTQTQLSDLDGLLYDYMPSPTGEEIYYSVLNTQNGSDIWVMGHNGESAHMVVNCGLDLCSTPIWSPETGQLAYSRSEAGLGPNEPYSASRIWLLDTQTGKNSRLFARGDKIGYGPSWSPDGSTLAYMDGVNSLIVFVDMETQEIFSVRNRSGRLGSWTADSSAMIYHATIEEDNQEYDVIYRVNIREQTFDTLVDTSAQGISYSQPEISQDGKWLLVKGQQKTGSFNDSLVLINLENFESTTVTAEGNYTYLHHSFDPGGEHILYQRIQLGVANSSPEIMIYTIASGETAQVAVEAAFPNWLP